MDVMDVAVDASAAVEPSPDTESAGPEGADRDGQAESESAAESSAELSTGPSAELSTEPSADLTPGQAKGSGSASGGSSGAAAVPEQRPAAEAEPDPERGRSKRRKAMRNKSAGGTKALVVWREGKVQYADESVLVVDLDEAAAADTDVHDVVDRLTELREALDSPGRADAVALLAEIIQEKALN